ncbi:Type I restriction-modification system methyltransferase subunit [Jannaschia seosinensis]|uniref:Type I restriction-modification system methyltransferase subunit n=2 Tax=Jannaschia seosinensis TaxID=313367 RepID=A0A0M7B8U9_9RHOB|nr:Type I restriction-modification system methyltransferase subunit [Jannaschia seosinensis]
MPGIRATLFGPNPRPGYSDPLVEPEEVRTTIRNHPEFGAFRDRIHAILDGWAGQNAPLMDGIQVGDKPKALIHTIAEDMLTRFAEAPLIDQYEAYQRLMAYWAEVMQDDVFIIAHDGWEAAKELREARKEVDGNKVKWLEEADLTVNKVRLVADVVPPRLIVAHFFPQMQQELEDAQAKAEELGREIEELVEEHGAEGGLLADALTEAGKLTAASVKARMKDSAVEPEEAKLLKQVAKLMTAETAAKKAVKEAEEALIEATLKKYPDLTQDEIRSLVVDDKWLTDIAGLIEAEIEARTEHLTARVRVLTERYGHTLRELTENFGALESKVADLLRAMGFAQ